MVSTRPVFSKSSSPSTSHLVTVPRAPITIGITVTFMFHSFFFQFPPKLEVHILLYAFFFKFYTVIRWKSKIHNFASSLFFFYLFIYFFWLLSLCSEWISPENVPESPDACATSLPGALFVSFWFEVKRGRHGDREEGVVVTSGCRSRRTENIFFFSCCSGFLVSSRSPYNFLFGHSSL